MELGDLGTDWAYQFLSLDHLSKTRKDLSSILQKVEWSPKDVYDLSHTPSGFH